MKFEKVRLLVLRLRLRERGFYEDISFKDKLVEKKFKKNVAKWMVDLRRYKQIQVDKFKDLFTLLNEVVFPITIDYCHQSSYSLSMEFTDNNGHIYYMSNINIYNHNSFDEYLIGRRANQLEPFVDREFHYKICENKTIELLMSSAMKLDKYGLNDEFMVDFYYNEEEQETEALLEAYLYHDKIKIIYPTISDEFDKKVLQYLFSIGKKSDYYYDVFPILEWIATEIPNKETSVLIVACVSKDNDEISSEIQVVDGIVQRYVITKIISEDEVQKVTVKLSKSLEKFLKEKV